MKLYLAGPMRGVPLHNFPAFDAAAARLRNQGHEVFSPADHDRHIGLDENHVAHETAWYMAHDLPEVCRCDALVLLPDWKSSRGTQVELAVADALGKPILDAETLQPIKTGVFIATMEL